MAPSTRERLEAAHRYSAFYRGGFANHLPMALVALDAMGAGEAAIARFARRYEEQLEPLGAATVRIDPRNAQEFVGRASAFPAWVAFFESSLQARGATAVLDEWVERLSPGVGTAAFHGAIRLAYALESGSLRETAHALAYWTAAFEAFAEIAPRGTESPAALLAALSRAGFERPPGRSITARMRTAAAAPEFAATVARLAPEGLSLDAIAGALVRAYCASGDFTLLHGVTGAHALRGLLPHVRDRERALRHYWTAIVAAYLAAGAPPVEGFLLEGDDRHDWAAIHARAAACDDEHDVKLAYSCWREWQRSGDDLYRRAASARVAHARVGEAA